MEELEKKEQPQVSAERKKAIDEEMKKITDIDCDIKTFDDLMGMERADAFAEKVRKGYSLSDAYMVVNSKKIFEKQKSAALKAAAGRFTSKRHLTGAGTSGGEMAVDVPSETYALYKAMYPDLSDSEIKKHYSKRRKGGN